MSKETVKIGKWDVPRDLIDEYVKAQFLADAYALKNQKVVGDRLIISDMEIAMRWNLCVQHAMELHRKICKMVGVLYSENSEDEFYKAFIIETQRRVRSLRSD